MSGKKIIEEFINHLEKYYRGDKEVLIKVLATYFSGGNLLINDVPGTGKTRLSSLLSKSIHASMKRIQFTADLMASDLVGVKIYDPEKKEWRVSKGPLFSDIVFADEINRAPPQTQSALLEAMSEKQVSIEGETFLLPKNYFIIATQNPKEFDGTHPLPEAQLDRFSSCLTLGYLKEEDEIDIILGEVPEINDVKPILELSDVEVIKNEIKEVTLNKDIAGLIVKILNVSRHYAEKKELVNGLSIRAGISLSKICKAYAYIKNQPCVDPDMVFSLAPMVIDHRLKGNKTSKDILNKIISENGVYNNVRL